MLVGSLRLRCLATSCDHQQSARRRTAGWALDRFFKTLRSLDLYDGDPLLDSERSSRPGASIFGRSFDAEVERCRGFTRVRHDDTMGPVRWALAEASATAPRSRAVPSPRTMTPRRRGGSTSENEAYRVGLISHRGVEPSSVVSTSSARQRLGGARRTRGPGPARTQQAAISCGSCGGVLNRAGLAKDKTVQPGRYGPGLGCVSITRRTTSNRSRSVLGRRSLDDAAARSGCPTLERDDAPPHRKAMREDRCSPAPGTTTSASATLERVEAVFSTTTCTGSPTRSTVRDPT